MHDIDSKGTETEKPWERSYVSSAALVGAGENGGKYHTFRDDEIPKLLPKNIARAAKI